MLKLNEQTVTQAQLRAATSKVVAHLVREQPSLLCSPTCLCANCFATRARLMSQVENEIRARLGIESIEEELGEA